MIEIRRLSVNFGAQKTLQDINLKVPTGSFTTFVGPSGCGKSTLLRCIAALQNPTSGDVIVESESSDDIAFVFQSPNLLPWRNVLQNVWLPMELRQQSDQRTRQRDATKICELVGLNEQDYGKSPKMLSGGMQMRVSLARALITDPKILLLDEPFAALDDILRQELNGELLRLWSEKKWTSIFVTHNVAEAVFLSQSIVVLTKTPGRIADIVEVPFSYPRAASLRTTPEFAALCGKVSDSLWEAAR